MTVTTRELEGKGRLLYECASSGGEAGEVVGVYSPRFRHSGGVRQVLGVTIPRLPLEIVNSAVYVMRDAALAGRDMAKLRSTDGRSCLEHLIAVRASAQVRGEAYKSGIEVSFPPSPVAGIEAYGLHVSGTVAALLGGTRTRPAFYDDTFSFVVGRAEIVLRVESTPRPIRPALERKLLSLLYSRARAHKL
jgi:hypothetical protein